MDAARTTLPSSVHSPSAARAFACGVVARGPARVRVDDVALVVSELVTNAVVHGEGEITLDVLVAPDSVHVEVRDAEPRLPDPVDAPFDAESGRGLQLVSKVATRWGVRPADSGKVVWADLVRS